MLKTPLIELKKTVFADSKLIAIPSLEELLSINDSYSADEVFSSILKEALEDFERRRPHYLIQKIYVQPIDGCFDFVDNFKLYLQNSLAEDQINIVPTSIVGFSMGLYNAASTLYRRFDYNAPTVSNFFLGRALYYATTTVKRPIVHAYSNDKSYTSNSMIYYLGPELGVEYTMFRKQVVLAFIKYVLDLSENLTIPNLPIEAFNGLRNYSSDLFTELDNYYTNSLPSGKYIR